MPAKIETIPILLHVTESPIKNRMKKKNYLQTENLFWLLIQSMLLNRIKVTSSRKFMREIDIGEECSNMCLNSNNKYGYFY